MKWFGIMMPLGLGDGECIKREKRSRDSICMLLPVATLPNAFFFSSFGSSRYKEWDKKFKRSRKFKKSPKSTWGVFQATG
jgi:hypothetical protein